MAEMRTVEDYLIDIIRQKYAKRVLSKLNTEYERLFIDAGKAPDIGEYNWMVKRVLEINREMNKPEVAGEEHAKETAD